MKCKKCGRHISFVEWLFEGVCDFCGFKEYLKEADIFLEGYKKWKQKEAKKL